MHKAAGCQWCHPTNSERGLYQTTRSDVGTVGLQNFTWFLGVGHNGIQQSQPSFQSARFIEGTRTDEFRNNKEMRCHWVLQSIMAKISNCRGCQFMLWWFVIQMRRWNSACAQICGERFPRKIGKCQSLCLGREHFTIETFGS